jgi:hypothetical protein
VRDRVPRGPNPAAALSAGPRARRLARAPSRAEGDNLVGTGEVDALDGDLHSEHLGFERQRDSIIASSLAVLG